MRRMWIGVPLALGLTLAACGSGTLTLDEYAHEVEDRVADMEARFEEIDSEWESGPANLERAERYWEERLQIRHDFLSCIQNLTPPGLATESHLEAIELFTKITDADEALAAKATSSETITGTDGRHGALHRTGRAKYTIKLQKTHIVTQRDGLIAIDLQP